MSSTDLDDRLAAMTAPLPAAVHDDARRMALDTMPQRIERGRAPRARWAVPALVIGAVALTGGASAATAAMLHWAGVSMPLENVRSSEPIPVAWSMEDGQQSACRVWIELRNPEPSDLSVLDTAILAEDWSGLGQRLYDKAANLPDDPESPDGSSLVSVGLSPVMQRFADEVFPGIHWFADGVDTDERAVDAWGMTCLPEAE